MAGSHDGLAEVGEKCFVSIDGPTHVALLSNLFGVEKQRVTYINASIDIKFTSEYRLPIEEFLIRLQIDFEDTKDRQALLDFLSKVDITDGTMFQDNGVSQTVTVKRGVSGAVKDLAPVPSPVTLVPFRTFPEIDQPEAKYIFRLKKNGDSAYATLNYIDDGGKWKLEALGKIAAWLSLALPKDMVILA